MMLINHSALHFHLPNKPGNIYFLLGLEYFQINSMADLIKSSWRQQQQEEISSNVIYINNPADWVKLAEHVDNYSLFSNTSIIDVRYEKKSLDNAGKQFFEHYLKNVNPTCLLLLRTPELPAKALQFAVNHPLVNIIIFKTPNASTVKKWLGEQLQQKFACSDVAISDLIYQYNQGNLSACIQLLEKLTLLIEPGKTISGDEIKQYLIQQSNFSLFALAEACLSGNKLKALQIIQQAAATKTEPLLILWLLAQETRLLMQLIFLCQTISFTEAVKKLKIWQYKVNLYQQAIKKLQIPFLTAVLQSLSLLDKQIKNNKSQVWQRLERLTLALCSGMEASNLV